MFANLSIKAKITFALLGCGIVPTVVILFVSTNLSSSALKSLSTNQLTATREIKGKQIEGYFQQIKDQIITTSENLMVVEAMSNFKKSFHGVPDHANSQINKLNHDLISQYYQKEYISRLKKNSEKKVEAESYVQRDWKTTYLQWSYILENNHPVGEKHNLQRATDNIPYNRYHAQYHPNFKSFLEKFGYYDIFLVDNQTGHIVYSVFKEVDYATSLLSGPYASTNFADAFKTVRNASSPEVTCLKDFEPYEPSYNAPASFIACPIFENDKQIGVLIFQMPVDKINEIMTMNNRWEENGLGKTGETFLVAQDRYMRSLSRPFIEDKDTFLKTMNNQGLNAKSINTLNTTIGLLKINTSAVDELFSGKMDTKISRNYFGEKVISSYRKLNIENVNYGIVSEIHESEALSSITRINVISIIAIVICISVIVLVAFRFAISIIRPLNKVIVSLSDIAEGDGDLTKRLNINSKDEVGVLGERVDTFMEKLQTMIRDLSKKTYKLEGNSKDLLHLSDSFSESAQNLKNMTEGVTKKAEITSNNIGLIADSAKTINNSMNEVSGKSQNMTDIVKFTVKKSQTSQESAVSVSAAVEELSTTIDDLAQNTDNARTITTDAVQKVELAQNSINELGVSANEIEQIISLIVEISEQTKLLALNATIEAARAGDAGKGFSVVANEVKDLAKQTNEATENIKERILAIQSSTQKAVTQINDVNGVVSDVNNIVTSISSAIEEQSITSKDITKNIGQVNTGFNETAEQVKEMNSVIETVSSSVTEAANQINNVLKNVESASEASRQIAEDISQVDINGKQINDKSTIVKQNAQSIQLAGQAQKEMVDKFKV